RLRRRLLSHPGRRRRRPGRETLVRLFGAVPVCALRRAPRGAGLRARKRRAAASLDFVMEDAEAERKRRQRKRSLAIAWILAGLVVLFFIVTIVRLGGNVALRPI